MIERINELDKYVVVENNQFKLKIPKGIIIDSEILILAEKQILLSNDIVSNNNIKINSDKKAYNPISTTNHFAFRSAGVTAVELYWIFIRVKIDAPNIRLLGGGVIGGVSSIAGGLAVATIKNPSASVAAKKIVEFSIGTILGMLGIKLSEVHDGIWLDFNFFLLTITKVGWQ